MKQCISLIMGGMSGEHEVSILSAKNMMSHIPLDLYDVIKIGISKRGKWFLLDEKTYNTVLEKGFVPNDLDDYLLILSPSNTEEGQGTSLSVCSHFQTIMDKTDVFFPMVHGPNCEDGSLQGLLLQWGKPFVGCGVTASAVAMDKAIAKGILKTAGIPVVEDLLLYRKEIHEEMEASIRKVETAFHYPVFVKPCNLGSSVGVGRAEDQESLKKALLEGAKYDQRVLVERAVIAREIECGLLGHGDVFVSEPGEAFASGALYSYEDKYVSGRPSEVPASGLSNEQSNQFKKLSLAAFQAIGGSGWARVDFFLEKDTNKIYLNEINTIPGCTKSSMYPLLMTKSKVTMVDVIQTLITSAVQRKKEEDLLQRAKDGSHV